MPSLRSVAALALATGFAAGSPISTSTANKGFTVQQVHAGYKTHSLRQSIGATFAKFGGVPPPFVLAGNGTGTGSAPNQPGDQYDSLYLTPVDVGGTTLMLDFDTGSADLWVFSDELPSAQTSGHAIYKTDASKKVSGASWKISYGDGSGASGDVYKDTVTVGGIAVDGQDVEAAAKISAQFAQDKDNDGLLGLAFSTINTVKPQQATTWFDTAVKAGQLSEPIFGVRLEHQKAGSYDFGFADTKAYTGNLAYADIDSSQGFWEFKTDGFAVGDKTTNTPIQGIADTGTTLIYVPADVVKAYYDGVQGVSQTQGMYVFPCDAQLPDFSIIVSGQKITTPGEYVNYQPVDKTGSQCLGGIQPNDGLQGLSIFGDVILKNNYVVFDAKVPRIGWAAKSS